MAISVLTISASAGLLFFGMFIHLPSSISSWSVGMRFDEKSEKISGHQIGSRNGGGQNGKNSSNSSLRI